MPESSVDSYIAAQPETIMSKDEYWQEYKNRPEFYGRPGNAVKGPKHYNDVNYNIAKFFGSAPEKSFESAYEAYLNNVNNLNEFKATQSAREYEKMMDDTKYQRMFKDFEKAGLNPYLILNNGGISASAAPSSAKGDYKASQKAEEKSNNGRNFALLMLALARVVASLL